MSRIRSESWAPERDQGPGEELTEWILNVGEREFFERVQDEKMEPEEIRHLLWWYEHGIKYHERPVSVEQFLFSRHYMKAFDESGERIIWPKLVEAIERVCTGGYIQSIWTGAIGTGKSTGALYATAYKLYELLCLKSPHATYELDPSSEILIIFQSLNKDLAVDVDYTRFKAMIDRAPIFATPEFRYDRSIKSEMKFGSRVVCKPVAGTDAGALGQNVIGGILDEISSMAVVKDSRRARDKEMYDQAVALYDSIERRRESRFMEFGDMPGMLCLIGSKKYPDDFLHQKIDEAADNPKQIHLYDEVLWSVRPERFGKKRFRVFVGDTTRKPRIMEEAEELPESDQYLLRRIPVEYRRQFDRDLLGALRDIAGVANLSIHPFILDRDALAEAFGKTRSVGSRPDVDFQDYNLRLFPQRWAGTEHFPRMVHLDLALSGDSAGLAVGHVRGFKRLRRSETTDEILPVIRMDLMLEIRPPRAGEIQFEKIRRLLYLLREHGMPIKWASADGWQSIDMLQILASKGVIVGQESTDKNPAIYEVAKGAIYDRRAEFPEHPKCLWEFTRLERDPATGKIDHPIEASKDVSDATATVIYGLSLQAEIWVQFGIDLRHVPDTLLELADRNSKHDMDGKV